MEQLPKIVAQRLQAVSLAEMHPDANLLTAFAEKSLLPREQTQVLEHLAVCTECREVVAHALPEEVLLEVAVAAAAPTPARRNSWFAGASVRWIALAACVVIVGTVVISRTHFSPSTKQAVSSNQPDVVARNEPQTSPSTPPAEESRAKESTSDIAQPKGASSALTLKRDADQVAELDKQQSANTALRRFDERRQPENSYDRLEAKNNKLPAADAVIAGAPAATETVTVESAASPVEDTKATKKEFSADKAMRAASAGNEVAQAQAQPQSAAAPPPVPPPAAKTASVLADSQTVTAESVTVVGSDYKQKDGYAAGAAIGSLAKMRAAIIPMWQLSDGKLIKSLDHGQNWQPVPVDDKSVFQALCVTGNEIWVGGKQGTLFYSSDSGQQWEQVKPAANGQTLTADITAIEFKDPKHGKLTAADHQTWTTNDGGHNWKLESR
jgi:hypothetical protein